MKIEQLVSTLLEKIKKLVSDEASKMEVKFLEKQHAFELKVYEKMYAKDLPSDERIVLAQDWDIEFDEDTRTLKMFSQKSDGTKIEKSVKLPTMLYRGVYEDEKSYEKGDCVTHDGSMWVCKSDTSTKPGTEGCDWQLSVKRGPKGKGA